MALADRPPVSTLGLERHQKFAKDNICPIRLDMFHVNYLLADDSNGMYYFSIISRTSSKVMNIKIVQMQHLFNSQISVSDCQATKA